MLDHSLALCHPTGSGLVGRSRKNEDLSLLKPNERVETAPPIRKEAPGESENCSCKQDSRAKEERKTEARKYQEKPHFLPRVGPSSSLQEVL